MKLIQHYFNVYKKFISTSIQVESSFRTSYALIIFMDLFFFISSLASVNFIYDHVETIGPWKREQLLFFVTFVLSIDNLHMMIFSQNFWQLSFMIKTGELDYVILKPMSTIFSVFFRHFRSSSLFNTPIMIFFLIKYGTAVNLSPIDWLLLPVHLILGLTILVLIEFCLSTAMFWMVEGIGINFLRMQLQSLSRWPAFIYSGFYRKFFTLFVPVLLVGSAPVEFIYDKTKWIKPLQLIFLIVVFYFLLLFLWEKGLKRYDSASS